MENVGFLISYIGLWAGITLGAVAIREAHDIVDLTKSPSLKLRTEDGEFQPVISVPAKKHGLIVLGEGGRLEETFENTSNLVYTTLREHGYERDNLFVLEGKKRPSKRFDCHTLPSSKKHLKEVLNQLSRDVSPEDAFFMYALCHGEKELQVLPLGQSILSLDEGSVGERELEELLSDLHPDHSITFFNNCYSGGFAQRLGKSRNIAISTSRRNKTTNAWGGVAIERKFGKYASPFSLFFFSTLRGQMPNGENIPLQAATVEQAFDFAASRQHSERYRIGGYAKNTPLLVYGSINPAEVGL